MASNHLAFCRKRLYIKGMMKRVYVILAVLGVIFLLSIILPKDKQQNSQIEPQPEQQVRSEKVEVEGKLVEGFPQLPIFPDATVEKSYKKESGGKVGYEAVYLTNKFPKEAMVWYREELEKQGWTIIDEQIEGTESEFSLMVERGGKKVNVFAENEDGETEISVEIPLQ